MMGYGAVGITKSGCGSVPRAEEAYPYCFADMPMTYPNPPAYILINHGANDRGASAEEYITGYRRLLDLIRRTHPQAKLIALSAFCGAFAKELGRWWRRITGKTAPTCCSSIPPVGCRPSRCIRCGTVTARLLPI